MKLEQYLVLNRYFHHLLGARGLEELKGALASAQEGIAGDGESYFFKTLASRAGLNIDPEQLKLYDAQVVAYQERLTATRLDFRLFRYFQYLALLYTEIYLDKLTENPALFLGELNEFLNQGKQGESLLQGVQTFSDEDMRRLAFFMATGSGKTLLLHVNLWQLQFYLANGKHPEALVQRSDGRQAFRNILLITPNEGLTRQHLDEFRASGISAVALTESSSTSQAVKVIDIHKLVEEVSGSGVTIPLASLGSDNLIFVDEGHKGTGSEAQTWKNRQKALSENGFLIEYSATFAQAIEAAGRQAQSSLYSEYGKAILFDYSYRHFYTDGYGKDFRVLNLERGGEEHAHALLMGGLLIFFGQMELYQSYEDTLLPYNIAVPLWVFIGSSVNAVFTRNRQKQSDVATVVAFLRRLIEDRDWAIATLRTILDGESGFADGESGEDLFARHLLETLKREVPEQLYERILRRLFHGRGELEVWELKNTDGELGLRVSTPESVQSPYFGVISIGDVATFKRHLHDNLELEVQEDHFTRSLFEALDQPDSRVNLLIGAKKFIEGWNSWRVSTMGLLNIGKGEGSQVIQLFGRGVRLRGKDAGLKRSAALPENEVPSDIGKLETLYLFGWNADYIKRFQANIQSEGLVAQQLIAPVTYREPWPSLPIPLRQMNYDPIGETWILDEHGPDVALDFVPRVSVLAGMERGLAQITEINTIRFDGTYQGLLDFSALHRDLLTYKQQKRHVNLFIRPGILSTILEKRCEVTLPGDEATQPEYVQQAAQTALRTYLDRYIARKEREAESSHLQLGRLASNHPNIIEHYTLSIADEALLQQIRRILHNQGQWLTGGQSPLPRFFLPQHLYNPILKQASTDQINISPPGLNPFEARFINDLRAFWDDNHHLMPYASWEIYLLRNRPQVGIGFFQRSGFYPDFILWIKNTANENFHLVFIEPHGMHHQGLFGVNRDKIEALKSLSVVSQTPEFHTSGVTLDGYIITSTPKNEIPGAESLGWEELEAQFRVMDQDTQKHYIEKLVRLPDVNQ